jgi:ABC-type uncharacterized transport system ATPase subunit
LEPVIELKGITKRFPAVLANDHIDMAIRAKEVFAIVGENGAGKTTLMNIIYGLYQPDSGKICIRGTETKINGPHQAITQGIGMVHQHFMLVPVLTVAENVVLGVEPTKFGGVMDMDRARKEVAEFSQKYGMPIDPDARVEFLSVGMQQRVEIIKALFRGAEILILDEPTAVLTPLEREGLFLTINALVKQGKTVIFISHKLNEVLSIADRIAVLRGGRMMGVVPAKGTTEAQLARMMVGRDVVLDIPKNPQKLGDIVMEVRDLKAKNERGLEAVKGVSFHLRRGEILGVAGVEVLTGLNKVVSGQILINQKDVTGIPVKELRQVGIAHIPQDRLRTGLVLPFNISENLILGMHTKPPFSRGNIQERSEIALFAKQKEDEFDIRPRDITVKARSLSGGNQQKVIIAREVSSMPEVMIAAQPTRGLDIGATEFVHRKLLEERDKGKAVLLISLELEEILSLSDRIMVMYGGEIVGCFDAKATNEDELAHYMLGLKRQEHIDA